MQRLLRTRVAAAVAVAFVLVSLLWAPRQAIAAGPWYVGPAGSDTPGCGTSPGNACQTIGYVLASVAGFTPGDTILLAPGTLTESVAVSKNVIIIGAGAGATTLAGNAARAITVGAGISVTLDALTLTGATPTSGGAVWNDGTLTLLRAVVSGTEAGPSGQGGGIYNAGVLVMADTTVTQARAEYGGGIYNAATGTAALSRVVIEQNEAEFEGGGVFNEGELTLSSSAVRSNRTTGGGTTTGAGLSNTGGMTLTQSSVTLNQTSAGSQGIGGGLYSLGSLVLQNVAVLTNTAVLGGGINVESPGRGRFSRVVVKDNFALAGGGLHNSSPLGVVATESAFVTNRAVNLGGGITNDGVLSLTNVTIGGNQSDGGQGAGLDLDLAGSEAALTSVAIVSNTVLGMGAAAGLRVGADTRVVMSSTLLAYNAKADCLVETDGELDSAGNNLAGTAGGCGALNTPNDRINLDPRLAPLTWVDSTFIYPLSRSSPAINSYGFGAGCPAIDQRGQIRPQGLLCDIGPREATPVDLAVTVSASAPSIVLGTPLTFVAELSNNSAVTATGALLTSTWPANLTSVACAEPQVSCSVSGGVLRVAFGTVAAGAKPKATLNVTPDAVGVAALTFIASSDDPDPNSSNDSAAVSVTIEASADLDLVATGPAGPVASSGPFGLSLAVTNQGPTAAGRPVVTVSLPDGAALFGWNGDQWVCQTGTGSVVCTYQQAQLPVGPAQPLQLILKSPSSAGGIADVPFAATVAAGSNDPQSGNNVAVVTVQVAQRYLTLLPIAIR